MYPTSSYPIAASLSGGGEFPRRRLVRLIHWSGGTGVFVAISSAKVRWKRRRRKRGILRAIQEGEWETGPR